ncbi:PKD domain-containing protein, partial [candidate division KSB1 bacterium]|nr:PKD domain-containing protein [candidate division KSB1 bacterium]
MHFKDLSLGWVEWWNWDFGDGSTSTDQHPCHTYSDHQKYYTVTLKSGGPCGSGVLVKTKYITVNVAVTANFEAKPIGGIPGLNVQFTTIYSGNAGHFIYDYGDGTTEDFLGDFQNVPCPKHIYREPGEYDVTLMAHGSGGKDTLHIPNLVYVDKTYRLRELQLLSGGATWPGEGWDNAVDHDIYG